jgi:hypothetical protein
MTAANLAGVVAILFGEYASDLASGQPGTNASGCQCSIAFGLAADRTDFAGHW